MKQLFVVEGKFERQHCQEYYPNCVAIACGGHIKQILEDKVGFDLKTFEPMFEWIPKATSGPFKDYPSKKQIMQRINHEGESADAIYICTDDDREGEAIAYHVYTELSPTNQKKAIRKALKDWTMEECQKRFNQRIDPVETSYTGGYQSLKNCDKVGINTFKVGSQWFRGVLDRIIGFPLSNYVQCKFEGAKSAGRVQSIPLVMLIMRNDAITNFQPKTTYGIEFFIETNKCVLKKLNQTYKPVCDELAENKECVAWNKLKLAQAYKNNYLLKNKFKVVEIKMSETKTNPNLPYTNLKLLADANKILHLATDQVKDILDMLYRELILITYPRTDSHRIDETMCKEFLEWINKSNKFNSNDINNVPPNELFFNQKKSKGQDGHAAITPVKLNNTPASVKNKIHGGKSFSCEEAFGVYKLIYDRTMLAFLKAQVSENTKIVLENNGSLFENNNSSIKFLGWKKYSEKSETRTRIIENLAYLEKAREYEAENFNNDTCFVEHVTTAPKPYTQSSILDDMEERMIGRPSTTATIFKILKDRKYITGGEGGEKLLKITALGEQVGRELMKNFNSVINLDYSIKMEQIINQLAEGQTNLYVENLQRTKAMIQNEIRNQGICPEKKPAQISDKKCPKCGKALALREGKYGKFLGCIGYPKCKYLENIPGENKPREFIDSGQKCPKCGKALALRVSKKGTEYLACVGYPGCGYVEWVNDDKKYKSGAVVYNKNKEVKKSMTDSINDLSEFGIDSGYDCPKCGDPLLQNKNGDLKCLKCGYSWSKKK